MIIRKSFGDVVDIDKKEEGPMTQIHVKHNKAPVHSYFFSHSVHIYVQYIAILYRSYSEFVCELYEKPETHLLTLVLVIFL